MKRLTFVTETSLEMKLKDMCVREGASGFTSMTCSGMGRRHLKSGDGSLNSLLRIEVVCPESVADAILVRVREQVLNRHPITVCVDSVDVVRRDNFDPNSMEEIQERTE